MIPFNQTKIICTIGPASDDISVMRELIIAGMDCMRMNFSHGDYEQHLKRLQTLYALNNELGTHIASLLDTKGPEIRTHLFKDGKAFIKEGDKVVFVREEFSNYAHYRVKDNIFYEGNVLTVKDQYILKLLKIILMK